MNPNLIIGGAAAALLGWGLLSGKKNPVGQPTAHLPQPFIQLGSRGPAVTLWRSILRIPAGDTFDEATRTATIAWQSAHGLESDGKVGKNSWAKAGYPYLGATGGSPSSPTGPVAPSSPVDMPQAAPPFSSSESGRVWCSTISKQGGLQRDASIIAAVKAGFYIQPALIPCTYQKGGRNITIFAWADCLAIGLSDPIRANIGHAAGQMVADHLKLMLPTSRMSDAAWQASPKKLNPQAMGASTQMSSTAWMIEHSDKVSRARRNAGLDAFAGLARPVGKDWVNTERLLTWNGSQFVPTVPTHSTIGAGGGPIPAGANYGWQWDSAALWNPSKTIHVLQSVGLAHDMNYDDYSQVLTLYATFCQIDGTTRGIPEVLANPDTAYLLSDEVQQGTAAKVWRHPAVPEGSSL